LPLDSPPKKRKAWLIRDAGEPNRNFSGTLELTHDSIIMRTAALLGALVICFANALGRAQETTARNSTVSVSTLATQLSDPQFRTRFEAGTALCRLGTNASPAVPIIAQLLETEPDKFHDVMLVVVENCRATAQSIKPALQKCLASSNPHLQMSSARTLWVLDQTTADQARPVANNNLKATDAGLRIEAASLLWRMDRDTKQVVPVLAALLRDPDQAFDYRTLKLLGTIGPAAKDAVPEIKYWLEAGHKRTGSEQPKFIHTAAHEALQKISGS
jgi:hypothetical protein